ncbi:hypothetical protein K458DRAFT_441994 [Lentithecium fluviatile CBS 122367]|uniref:Uncharacterized protein n=1 Tax=Lentithecium fluviatile CBS 122367 TaxID=1168545 RepID=A0A6G1J5U2_9PLEO|nr:hypothetical protein K458DRAFT_441994 [Lentithecium fluviatile CBS 122367]
MASPRLLSIHNSGVDNPLNTWAGFFDALQLRNVPLLAVNALATAAAILMGQSILFPIDEVSSESDNFPGVLGWSDTATPWLMVGSIGLASTLTLRRSYLSFFQIGFFSLVTLCFGGALRAWTWRRVYEALSSTTELNAMESDNTVLSDGSDATRVAEARRWRSISQRFSPYSILLASIWIPYLMLNFSEWKYLKPVRVHPALDREYTPKTAVQIVVSMYKEPVDEVAQLISKLKATPNLRMSQVHIYIKDSESNTTDIKERIGANNITTIPNIGREGETYLYHILNNWDALAKHTVFLQADVHNPREFYPRIRDYFHPVLTVCSCENCGDRFGFSDTKHLFLNIHNRINNSTQCENVLLSYKGQFIVSAKRIRGVDKSVYRDLHNAFVDKDSWAHQEGYLQGRPDSMSAPLFGYMIERIWNLLFQCNDMEVAWKCPSLLSGSRIGGSIQDCQCFDPIS